VNREIVWPFFACVVSTKRSVLFESSEHINKKKYKNKFMFAFEKKYMNCLLFRDHISLTNNNLFLKKENTPVARILTLHYSNRLGFRFRHGQIGYKKSCDINSPPDSFLKISRYRPNPIIHSFFLIHFPKSSYLLS